MPKRKDIIRTLVIVAVLFLLLLAAGIFGCSDFVTDVTTGVVRELGGLPQPPVPESSGAQVEDAIAVLVREYLGVGAGGTVALIAAIFGMRYYRRRNGKTKTS